ncbi:MAG: DUF1844 domain-containing protein [Deltaproteobacteria bacterium]|jgi:hypothetical protein|nr:DUF1844 domain-containing protein [Deltaproteobacteria bacterium]
MAEANGAGRDDAADAKSESGRMPRVSFSTFILSLASSALVQLGEVENPETGKTGQDLVMARHTIDILCMLQSKTRECLDPDELRLMEGVLYDLRLKYVLKTK